MYDQCELYITLNDYGPKFHANFAAVSLVSCLAASAVAGRFEDGEAAGDAADGGDLAAASAQIERPLFLEMKLDVRRTPA